MTARSKVTLVEAQQIRSKLVQVVASAEVEPAVMPARAVDALLALGLIETDAALRLVASDE